jgi:hypothetical protein
MLKECDQKLKTALIADQLHWSPFKSIYLNFEFCKPLPVIH